jgi:thiamine-monophosphate kinase
MPLRSRQPVFGFSIEAGKRRTHNGQGRESPLPGGELAFIDWIRRQTHLDPALVPLGPGDDCAIVSVEGRQVLFTTDMFLDGTHFDLTRDDPVLVGRKAMAANLSDMAAMAGLPRAAVASVGLPKAAMALARALHHGMRLMADAYACPIVGGDVTAWTRQSDRLSICIGMLGEPGGIDPVRRSGAQIGDVVLVTGRLGGSLLGRHLTFEPRVAEARALAQAAPIHAMMDVSDGLSSDLAHLTAESGVGAVIRAADVPIHPDAEEVARTTGRAPLHHALNDGEDFELLFTTDEASAARLLARPPIDVLVTPIGRITAEGLALETAEGQRTSLVPRGYEHDLGE